VVFTPTTGFHGATAFGYTISDGTLTAQGAVTVTVGDDLAPVAVADAATVAEASVATPIDVLTNDTDPDGGPRSVMAVTQPDHGAAAIAADGLSVTYTPATGYCNEAPNAPRDRFTYMLIGGSSAAVSIKVTCACGLHKPTDFVVGVAP
jgi:hypothetical protein